MIKHIEIMKTVILCSLLLFLLFAAPELGEARVCRVRSGRFHGYCFSDRNCYNVCLTEGYEGGDCEGRIHRHCTCFKRCPAN
nr:defensin 3 [Zingiber officinale]